MKIRFSTFAIGMVWGTLPLMGGLCYWEHTLQLLPSEHTLAQILLLPVIIGWVYFWNEQSEIDRLRNWPEHEIVKPKVRYRFVTADTHESEERYADSIWLPSDNGKSSEGAAITALLYPIQDHPIEVEHYASKH